MSTLVSDPPPVTVLLKPRGNPVVTRPMAEPVTLVRAVREFLQDGLLVVLAVFLIPAAILVIGVPIALVGLALVEMVQRLF